MRHCELNQLRYTAKTALHQSAKQRNSMVIESQINRKRKNTRCLRSLKNIDRLIERLVTDKLEHFFG